MVLYYTMGVSVPGLLVVEIRTVRSIQFSTNTYLSSRCPPS